MVVVLVVVDFDVVVVPGVGLGRPLVVVVVEEVVVVPDVSHEPVMPNEPG